jgi:putative phosphoribosyl transferase
LRPRSRALGVPLDIWVVRKVGAPFQPELGIGAVAEGGEVFIDELTASMVGVSEEELAQLIKEKMTEVLERAQRFRKGQPPPLVRDRVVIIVDDGIATGGTTRAAVRALRKRGARRIVLAVPVASTQALEAMRDEVDDIVCLYSDPDLQAIGLWYRDFSQTPDEEVAWYLQSMGSHVGVEEDAR